MSLKKMNPYKPDSDRHKAWELGYSHTEFKPPRLRYYGKDDLLEAYTEGFSTRCEKDESKQADINRKPWNMYWY